MMGSLLLAAVSPKAIPQPQVKESKRRNIFFSYAALNDTKIPSIYSETLDGSECRGGMKIQLFD